MANYATMKGGAVAVTTGAAVDIVSSFAYRNQAGDKGGALSLEYESRCAVENCTFQGNAALDGGGLWVYGGAALTVSNSTLRNNSAANKGGAVAADYLVDLTLVGSLLRHNSAA
eukprot:gene26243-32162_t